MPTLCIDKGNGQLFDFHVLLRRGELGGHPIFLTTLAKKKLEFIFLLKKIE